MLIKQLGYPAALHTTRKDRIGQGGERGVGGEMRERLCGG